MKTVHDPTAAQAWAQLVQERRLLEGQRLSALFDGDDSRFDTLSFEAEGVFVDFSKQHWRAETVRALVALAEARNLGSWIAAMFAGERVNVTERRPALHTALRQSDDTPVRVDGADVIPEVRATQARVRDVSARIREGRWIGATGKPIRQVVNIGIGGSDLGPLLVCEALAAARAGNVDVRFVSNVDPAHLARALEGLDAAATLFIVTSKTFTTLETLRNAEQAVSWLRVGLGAAADLGRHLVAVTAAPARARAFGIPEAHILPFWDWVGGRFSVWSAVGLPVAIGCGWDAFAGFLAGAAAIDRHFRQAPFARNLPVLLALSTVWNVNFRDVRQIVLAPYAQALARFPAYIQQLVMESNGKSVTRDGSPLPVRSAPAFWGEPGTNAQHAFFQWLHQGTDPTPVEFIVAANAVEGDADQHRLLVANALAQSRALMCGKSTAQARAEMLASGLEETVANELAPHRTFPGDRASTTLLVPRLDAFHLGQLLALFEHRTFVEAVVWGINPFDQFGVELGKQLTGPIVEALEKNERPASLDGSTRGLIGRLSAGR